MLAASSSSIPCAETATPGHDTLFGRMSPAISIVIPAYNEARRLPETLAGWQAFLRGQDDTWEILVVDDGSRDATAEVASTGGARVLRLAQNQGKGGAVKAGVLAANGQTIAYVDADMNVPPHFLEDALAILERGADLVVGQRDLSEYALAEGPIRLLAGGSGAGHPAPACAPHHS